MKKITLVILASLFVISCKKEGYDVTGLAKGVENGKKVFLELQNESGLVALDTVVVENEKFKFDGKLKDGLELAFVRIEALNGSVAIILENGSIAVEIDKDTIQKSKISGTKNNDKFQSFNDDSQVIFKKMMRFQVANQEKMTAAQQVQDTIIINALMKEYNGFQEAMNVQSKTFIEKNPDALISVLLLENFLMRKYITVEEVKAYYDKLDVSLLETKSAKSIKKTLDTLTALNVGSIAPAFTAPSPDGKMISLKESLGKVTLLDFWASWCAPCRKENPNVVAIYNEFHEAGFNIISVSLDKEGDAEKWKEAISKDGLTWNQVSNLKFWKDPIAEQYNIKSIPATFVLDASGKIVAKDLRGDELRAKVKELLSAK
ncbi:TlpA disulfide reductase family protein [uncultured Flavobacterium sp.]|jgi:peroxiredoxin|uniref:TlpA disulfide reductase family protein n=1 Tax=uncultured Flavobacterium sp. TaxID=165435 RepID=UPI0030CA40ED